MPKKPVTTTRPERGLDIPVRPTTGPAPCHEIPLAATGEVHTFADLSKIDEKELRAELERRRRAWVEQERAKRVSRVNDLARVLTRELIDYLTPLHRKMSVGGCSDDNHYNGWFSEDSLCKRCALLDLYEDSFSPESLHEYIVEMTLCIDRRPIDEEK